MKKLIKLNKMAFLAFAGLAIGGCGFFGDLFGVSNVNSTQGKFGEGQSVCNTLSKNDIFPAYYGNTFGEIGSFIGAKNMAQVENVLGAQVHYMELKRSEKESVCAFVMATNTAYKQVSLTSQEITKLEKDLVSNNKYSEYERDKYAKDAYFTAMKFLKYHNKLTTQNLTNLQSLGKLLWAVDRVDDTNFAARNITTTRFIHGKAQDERVYKEGPMALVAVYTNINHLNHTLKSPMLKTKQPCNSVSMSNAECFSRIDEIRAIKNYAESVLK